MYSIEEKLNNRLKRLIQFLVKREYQEDHVDDDYRLPHLHTHAQRPSRPNWAPWAFRVCAQVWQPSISITTMVNDFLTLRTGNCFIYSMT